MKLPTRLLAGAAALMFTTGIAASPRPWSRTPLSISVAVRVSNIRSSA